MFAMLPCFCCGV